MIQRTLLRQTSRALRASLHTSVSKQPLRSKFQRNAPLIPQVASRQFQGRRWYATEPEAKKDESESERTEAESKAEEKSEPQTEAKSETKTEVEDPMKKELDAKNREIIDLKDRLLRSIAEFRNLQERTKRDMAAARDFAIQKFAKDLVDSIDNLDRALTTVPAEKLSTPPEERDEHLKDLISLHEGLKMTESILMGTLKKHGLERFDPSVEGEKFNPNEHEATFMTPMEGKEDGTVFHTQQKGFKLNGRILRAAKVGVVKNSS